MTQEFFKNWEQVSAIPVTRRVALDAIVPKENLFQEEIPISRFPEQSILTRLWSAVKDPGRPDAYSKNQFVDDYFTVCVFSLRRMNSIPLAANQSHELTVQTTHTSSLRETLTETARLETVVSGTASDGMSSLSSTITASYEVSSVKEYADEKSIMTSKTQRYEATPYDRDCVTWDLVKTIALYRRFGDDVVLIGLGDFLAGTTQATYTRGQFEVA